MVDLKKLYELTLYPIRTVQEPELLKLSAAWLVKLTLIESTLGLQNLIAVEDRGCGMVAL